MSDERLKRAPRLLSHWSISRSVSINIRTFVAATRVVGIAQLLRVNDSGRRPLNCLVYNDPLRQQQDRLHVQYLYM